MCPLVRRVSGAGSVALLLAAAIAGVRAQGGAAAPPQAPPPQTPILRSGATAVLVDVYPQRDGRIVENLTAADFQLFEDGRPQQIDSVEFVRIAPGPPEAVRRDPNSLREMYALAADPRKRVFVAFLDEFHTTTTGSNLVRRPLLEMIDQAVGPDDLIGLMTARMRPEDVTFGRERLAIEEQLARYWTWGQRQRSTTERPDAMEDNLKVCYGATATGQRQSQPDLAEVLIERRREDQALGALHDLVQHLGRLREARTVVILVSDGWILFEPNQGLAEKTARLLPTGGITGTRLPGVIGPPTQGAGPIGQSLYAECAAEAGRIASIDSEDRLRQIISHANRGNVSIYPVATAGLAVFDSSLSAPVSPAADASRLTHRVEALRTLAENTDGRAVVQSNDITGGLRGIADDVAAYYLLGYSPTNAKPDGRFRRIEVKVLQPRLTVRARRGYVAPTEASLASAARETARPESSAGAVAALDALPAVSPSMELFTHARQGANQLTVVVEIATRVAQTAAWRSGGRVAIEAASGQPGGAPAVGEADIAPGFRSAIVRVPIGGAGPSRVRVRVSPAAGTPLTAELDVLAERHTLLGGVLAFRATPSPRSSLLPVADFQFRRTERLRVEWPALAPVASRSARLLDRRGQPLAADLPTSERLIDDERMLGVDLNLAPFAEGEYIVELTATRGDVTELKFAAFRLIR